MTEDAETTSATLATPVSGRTGRAEKAGIQPLPLALADLRNFDAIIDARSPAEFALDHLPGAINCPVLDDAERVLVGTLHKQQSPFDARKTGAAFAARNIARHVDELFFDKPKSWKPLVYCWRGGARSGSLTHILRAIGWDALQLKGGYKGWRAQVVADMAEWSPRLPFQVICGRTGSGKSRLLEALAEVGAQVLDLEKLAAHKGSVLGDLPDQPQPSQKHFESLIWQALSGFDLTQPVFVEAESRKIGGLQVPGPLLESMWQGHCFEAQTPAPLRIKLLHEEYVHLIEQPALLFDKLDCLKPLHPAERLQHWRDLALSSQWEPFVADMLEHHYDPAYQRSMFRNYAGAAMADPIIIDDISPAGWRKVALNLRNKTKTTIGQNPIPAPLSG